MLIERALERVAPVNGHPGGDAEIGQTAAPDHERQGILQRLKPPQKPVPFDRYTRADCRGPRLLQIGNDTLELYGAALVPTADLDVGIDDHDGLDACRQRREQAT